MPTLFRESFLGLPDRGRGFKEILFLSFLIYLYTVESGIEVNLCKVSASRVPASHNNKEVIVISYALIKRGFGHCVLNVKLVNV